MIEQNFRPLKGSPSRAQPDRLWHPGWAALFALLIAYGSLLPLDWRWPGADSFPDWGRLAVTPGSANDAVVNLFLYAALGAVALGACRGKLRPTRFAALFCGAAVLSGFCEFTQFFIAGRVPSVLDFVFNVAGAALGLRAGVLLRRCAPSWTVRAIGAFVAGPCQFAAAAITFSLLLYGIAPCDFITNGGELHRAFNRTELALSLRFVALPGNALAEAGWFIILGFMASLGALERSRPRSEALVSAVRHGLILIVVIELLHVFVRSQAFESSAIMLRLAAVSLGAWVGSLWIDPAHLPRRLSQFSPYSLPGGICLGLAYLIAASLDDGRVNPAGRGVELLPFLDAWSQPAAHGLFSLLWTAGWYFALAVILNLIAMRGGSKPDRPVCVLIVSGLALTCELLTFLAGGTADATRLVLALVAAVAAGQMVKHLSERCTQATAAHIGVSSGGSQQEEQRGS